MNTPTNKTPVVLIPAYQPRQALVESTNKLRSAGLAVVVVNDGSGTQYGEIFGQLDLSVHVLHHTENRGKGAALKTGFAYIQQTFTNYVIVTADADGQHAIEDIKKVAQDYKKHPGTLLLGSRTFETDNVPLRSRFGNTLTRKVFSLITRQHVHDTQTGLRAFDDSLTDFMLDVPGDRFGYEMNVLLACSQAGIEIVELPIATIYENNNETSHFDPIRDSLAIYGQIIKFASSSLIAFVIDYLLFVTIVHLTSSWILAFSVTFANIVARVVSASCNFTLNKRLVFKHAGRPVQSAVSYSLLATGILVVNTTLIALLTGGLGMAPYIAKIMTELTLFFVSYFVQKKLIFTPKKGEVV